jgi:HIP---CoA ligase
MDEGHSWAGADPGTVPGLLQSVAAAHGARVAVDDGTWRLTYRDLLSSVLDTAAALCGVVGPGERVALWAPNSTEWAVAALGVLFAGATVVPVNTRYTSPEMEDIVGRAGCRVVFAEHEFLGRRLAQEAHAGASRPLVVGLGPGAEPGTVAGPDFVAAGSRPAVLTDRLSALRPADISHVQYTSGTTGRPKGAMLRHGALVRTTLEWARVVGLTAGDTYPVIAPFSHIGGHKTGLLACLGVGATAWPFPTLDVDRLAVLIERGEVSVLQGPPTMFQALVARFRDNDGIPLQRRPRAAVTGGAAVAPALVRDIVSVLGVDHVFTAYGLTESTGVCTITWPTDEVATVAETSGRPIPGVELRVVDQQGVPRPPGQPGQIVVRGDSVMAGYLDDPDATADAVRDGWLMTGDIGWIGDDDCLRIVDRMKDVVIVGGLNAYPAEIERVLLECPGVDQAAVIGVADERLGEVPVAFVVAHRQSGVTIDQLEAHCRGRLANFKRPRRYVMVDELPANAAGKILKAELRRRAGA